MRSLVEGSKPNTEHSRSIRFFFVYYIMEKRKLSKSKTTGRGAAAADDASPELSVIVHVRKANYVPGWVTLRQKITDLIFTADIKKADLDKLETDEQVTSVSINEQLDSIK